MSVDLILLRIRRPLLAALALLLSTMPLRAGSDAVTVFAAASLTTALQEIGADWTAKTGHRARFSFAGSSALAKQIQAGAPADIIILASTDWMEALAASGDLRDGTRRDLLGNTLVLIAHGTGVPPVSLDATLDLAGMLGRDRLAMALVDAVPAGIYGKAALTSLGLWDSIAPQVAQADNVRAALAFVARGEAPLGIVYATDAGASDRVTIIGSFPSDSHPPITYPAAITATSSSPQAPALLDYLSGPTAREIWQRHGFRVLP